MKVDNVRKDFTVLQQKKPPIYFDNACMTLKPKQVTDALMQYYEEFPSCGQRSMHQFGKRVTEEMEASRAGLQKFIGAKRDEEIIFTRNTTEAINLLAKSYEFSGNILTSNKEHNSNLLPWQLHKNEHKIFSADNFDLQKFQESFPKNTGLLAFASTFNLDGSSLPIKEMVKIAHDNNAKVFVDAAQHAPYNEINVKKLDVDFLALSGHKLMGPTGTGIFYGKKELLEKMKPYNVGGDTVFETTYKTQEWEDLPHRFEAGLQDYAGIMGFGAAIEYVKKLGQKNIRKHVVQLNKQLSESLQQEKILGPTDAESRGGICSFVPQNMNIHDVALMLDQQKIMVRSGAHCVHSWFNANNMEGSVRASLFAYNTEEEMDKFIKAYKDITH